jgi:hypothetical protein
MLGFGLQSDWQKQKIYHSFSRIKCWFFTIQALQSTAKSGMPAAL